MKEDSAAIETNKDGSELNRDKERTKTEQINT